MRELGIYPVMRDAHLAEPERHVRDANEQLVDVFYLSYQDLSATEQLALAGGGSGQAAGSEACEEVVD